MKWWKIIGKRSEEKAYLHIWEKPYGWLALRVTIHDNGMGSQVVWFGLLGNCAPAQKKYTHVSIYACLRFSLGFYYAYQINNGEIVKKKYIESNVRNLPFW